MEKEARGQGTWKGLAELPNMIIQKYNGMWINTKWKGTYFLLGEAVGEADSAAPYVKVYAVLHLSYFISMALHPCLSHHIPHFCSSSDNGCSCYPLQTSLCRIVFPACYTKTSLPCSPREGQGRMALELLSPRSTMKQDHRALVMWESPGAAGTGTDGSSAKPDWKISRQSSNPN